MKPRYFRMSPAEKQGVVDILVNNLSTGKEIKFAFIYGSFNDSPDGDNMPFRDIDVGIYVTGMDKKQSAYYALELSDRLSSLVKVPVDVRVLNFAPITFLFHVVRGRLILDKDEDARCAFMEWVTRHYLDMKPLYHRAIKEAYGE